MQALVRQTTIVPAVALSLLMAGSASAAITFTETVAESDIARDLDGVFSPPNTAFVAGADTLLGNFEFASLSTTGKPFSPITTDLSTDDDLALVVQAPAGHQFRVHVNSSLEFELHFHTAGSPGVTLTPQTSITVLADGVPVTLVEIAARGVDPGGAEFRLGGRADFLAGTTFSQLTFALDYSLDSALEPLTVTPGTHTLAASETSHVTFFAAEPLLSQDPPPPPFPPVVSVEAVPEPASLALLGGAASLLALRRWRVR